MSFCAPPVILSAAKNLSSPLVANLLSHSGLLKILGPICAEDYQHLAENQPFGGQAICPAHKSVEKFLLFHYNR